LIYSSKIKFPDVKHQVPYILGSSVIVVTTVWAGRLDSNLGRGWDFSLYHRLRTGSGSHQTSYPIGIGVPFLGDKANWAWLVT